MIVATVFVWSNYGALGGLLTLAAIILGLIFIGTWDERADARRVQWQLEQVAQRGAVVEATRNMSGAEFEQLMAHLFRSRGYKAQMTKASGDQGMDLLLNKDGRRMAVQLKRYSKPVGNRAVQEALSAMAFYKTQEAWVVATSSFTRGAAELANGTGVRLIDGLELGAWMKEMGNNEPAANHRPDGNYP